MAEDERLEAVDQDRRMSLTSAELKSYAVALGVTTREAQRRLELEPAVLFLQQASWRDQREQFAGAWIDHDAGGVVKMAYAASTSPVLPVPPSGLSIPVTSIELVRHERSLQQLVDIQAALLSMRHKLQSGTPTRLSTSNFSIGLDVPGNYVEVGIPLPTGEDQAFFDERYGSGVRVVQSEDDFMCVRDNCRPNLRGGLTLSRVGGGGGCTMGFSITSPGSSNSMTTAGHCGAGEYQHYTSTYKIGRAVDDSMSFQVSGDADALYFPLYCCYVAYPGIYIQDGQSYSTISRVARASDYPLGGAICKSGRSTSVSCGTISDTMFAPGSIPGSFDFLRAKICATDGDSGGPAFASAVALGILSGGNIGGCTTNGGGGAVVDQGQRIHFTKAYNLEEMGNGRVRIKTTG